MLEASEEVLAFRHFLQPHRSKIWSTNLLERINEEIKRRNRVVGIFPNDPAITRLVGAVVLEQDERWQLEGRLMFSAESMAAIPSVEELPALLAASAAQSQAPGGPRRRAPTGRSDADPRPGPMPSAQRKGNRLTLPTHPRSDDRLPK
jgi:hypothetical protein